MLPEVGTNIPVCERAKYPENEHQTIQISFIVPVYNVEKYIRACVLSILALRDIPFEIILVDDGSVDGSMEKIADLIGSDPTITAVRQENRGQATARNRGLDLAKGAYIFFVDSDDMIDANTVQQVFSQRKGNEDIIIGDFCRWDGKTALKDPSLVEHPMHTTGDLMLQRFFLSGFEMVIGRNIYRHSFIKENRLSFLEGVYYEDADWTPRCLALAKEVRYINQPIYLYRNQREGSTMNSPFTLKKYHDLFKVAQTIENFTSTIDDKKTAAVINISAANLLLTALKRAELSQLGIDPNPMLGFYKKLKLPICNNKIMQYVLFFSKRLFFMILERRSM